VGVSHTAPKNHFGNMNGLLTAIAARGYEQLAEHMRRGLPENPTRHEVRNAAFEGYVDFARAQPALFELMYSSGRTTRDDPALKAGVGACFEILREASMNLDWDKAGAPDAELRAQIMSWSLVHGFAQLLLAGKTGQGTPRKRLASSMSCPTSAFALRGSRDRILVASTFRSIGPLEEFSRKLSHG
jgi:AcrR family transcriptional regulator